MVGSYPDETSARREINLYMSRYNEQRRHQELWNFNPNVVHEVNNKSEILADLEAMKFKSKSRRREYWALASEMEFPQKMIAMLKGRTISRKTHTKLGDSIRVKKKHDSNVDLLILGR